MLQLLKGYYMVILLYLLLVAAVGFVPAMWAAAKNRCAGLWYVFALVLPPVALLLAWAVGPIPQERTLAARWQRLINQPRDQLQPPADWFFLPAVLGVLLLGLHIFAYFFGALAHISDEVQAARIEIWRSLLFFMVGVFYIGFGLLLPRKAGQRNAMLVAGGVVLLGALVLQFYQPRQDYFWSEEGYVLLDGVSGLVSALMLAAVALPMSFYASWQGMRRVWRLGGLLFVLGMGYILFGQELHILWLRLFDKVITVDIGYIRKGSSTFMEYQHLGLFAMLVGWWMALRAHYDYPRLAAAVKRLFNRSSKHKPEDDKPLYINRD